MGLTGGVRSPQKIPNRKQPTPGVPGSRVTFFLRAAPRPIAVLVQGGSNTALVTRPVRSVQKRHVFRGSRVVSVVYAKGTLVAPSLARTRTLGSPALVLNPKPASLVRTRAQGSISVFGGRVILPGLMHARELGSPFADSTVEPPLQEAPQIAARTLRAIDLRSQDPSG